jgi:hypothetical protein
VTPDATTDTIEPMPINDIPDDNFDVNPEDNSDDKPVDNPHTKKCMPFSPNFPPFS